MTSGVVTITIYRVDCLSVSQSMCSNYHDTLSNQTRNQTWPVHLAPQTQCALWCFTASHRQKILEIPVMCWSQIFTGCVPLPFLVLDAVMYNVKTSPDSNLHFNDGSW